MKTTRGVILLTLISLLTTGCDSEKSKNEGGD